MRVWFFVALALLAAALPAQAKKPSPTELAAVDLINKAMAGIASAPECNRRPPEGTITHDAPSQELLDLLGILRRPATAEDSPPPGGMRFIPATAVYVDYVRLAHAADGRSYWIVPARHPLHTDPMPQSCLHRVHVRLRRLSHGQAPRVRRRALHFYNEFVRNNRELATRQPRDGVFVFGKRGDGIGGGGGGVDAAFIRERGEFGTSGDDDKSAIVNGLIPDGVATVTSTYGDYERTDRVQDNMVSFEVARSAERAFPDKAVWRDADGNVVKVTKP
jgi:hypothetical protein